MVFMDFVKSFSCSQGQRQHYNLCMIANRAKWKDWEIILCDLICIRFPIIIDQRKVIFLCPSVENYGIIEESLHIIKP